MIWTQLEGAKMAEEKVTLLSEKTDDSVPAYIQIKPGYGLQ